MTDKMIPLTNCININPLARHTFIGFVYGADPGRGGFVPAQKHPINGRSGCFGIMTGIGIGLVRDTSNLMVGQYFKRKREMVEIVVVGSSGLGIAITSLLIHHSIQAVGWRLGLQAFTGLVFVSFFLGVFYRSASLYHPQRRAILHLKNQKRKMKEKIKTEEKQQFFDFKTLKSRTFQIVLTSAAVGAFGISTPIVFLAYEAKQDGLSTESVLVIQVFLGIAFALGCGTFGFIIIRNSSECRIARQYLCQASTFMVAAATVAFTAVHGYHVRAHNFALAWSFIQWAQSIPMAFGAPITGYMNSSRLGNRSGYYFSSACVLISSIVLLLVDVHKRQIHKLHRSKYNPSVLNQQKCFHPSCVHNHLKGAITLPDLDGHINAVSGLHSRCYSVNDLRHPELTCISEEGIADLDDNMFDEYDQYLADCMTSCDQVEHYLMLSEYENNLNIKTREIDSIVDRNKRRRSVNRFQRLNTLGNSEDVFLSNEDNKSGMAEKMSISNSKSGPSANFNAWKLLHKTSGNIPVMDEITTTL
uniref:Major facilitator superfamily (MFS) profile domain-containing protein n=1 Tax=Strigamia maritima TaxID=126957 RepID=T1JDP4_STRMM